MKNLLLLINTLLAVMIPVTRSSAQTTMPTIVQKQTLNCSAGCSASTTITPATATTAGHMIVVSYTSTVSPILIKCGSSSALYSSVAQNVSAGVNSGLGTAFADIRYGLNVPSVTSCVMTMPSAWTGAAVMYEVTANTVDQGCYSIQADDTGITPGSCIMNPAAITSAGAATYPGINSNNNPITTQFANEMAFSALSGFPSTPTIAAPYTSTDYLDTASSAIFNSGPIATVGSSYMLSATWASGTSMPTGAVLTVYENPTLPTALVPILSPEMGSYGGPQTVSIVSPTNGSSVYYTVTAGTAGTTPTCTGSGTLYTAPFTISATSTVEAISCAAGYAPELATRNAWPNPTNNPPANNNQLTYTITGRTTPQTWYVRPAGGTRYSADLLTGQCNGLYDADYSGDGGTNENCAFNDFRFLYDSQGYLNQAWVMQGGDTAIVRGCISNPNTAAPYCRTGWSATSGPGSGNTWCVGVGAEGCQPPIPSGTSAQPTQILGGNYTSCTDGTIFTPGNQLRIIGGFGMIVALDLSAAQHVNVECVEVTSYGGCSQVGSYLTNLPCNYGDDYASVGIYTSNGTHDLYMQDVFSHGFISRGVQGTIGGIVTCLRCLISTNAEAGWDFDDGTTSRPSDTGQLLQYGSAPVNGTWNFNYSKIEYSGCMQVYTTNGFLPTYCFAQEEGGYGGSTGDAPGGCNNVNVNHSSFYFSLQDNVNWGHSDAGPSGAGYSDQGYCTETITNSYAFGVLGSDWKIGPNQSPVVMTGNVSIGNCARASLPIPGIPSTYNSFLQPGDLCRAAGSPLSFDLHAGNSAFTFSNNTIVSYASTIFGLKCWEGDYACPGSTVNFQNNIVYGFQSPTIIDQYGGDQGGTGGWFYGVGGPPATAVQTYNRSYNQWVGVRTENCPTTGYTGEVCSDPQFYGIPTTGPTSVANCLGLTAPTCTFVETDWDTFGVGASASYYLNSTSSPAYGTGTTYTGMPTTTFDGTAMPSPPVRGALSDNWTAPALATITVTPVSASVVIGGQAAYAAACLYTNSTTTPCNVTWTDTAAHSTVGSTTGVVTGVSIGSDTITATINTIYGQATVTILAAPQFVPMQGLLMYGRHN